MALPRPSDPLVTPVQPPFSARLHIEILDLAAQFLGTGHQACHRSKNHEKSPDHHHLQGKTDVFYGGLYGIFWAMPAFEDRLSNFSTFMVHIVLPYVHPVYNI